MRDRTLCLNMIVRNETANLPRCLEAVAAHLACWVIGDTGSNDGTQDFIKTFFAARGIPGELHEFPFVNFEQARNEAMERARRANLTFDYLLLADADMELVVEDTKFRSRLEAPCYELLQRSGLSYWNPRLVRRDAVVRYRGVTHEYLETPQGGEQFCGVWFKDHASGANRKDKIERDTRLLTEGLEGEPDNPRYWFYLAQTHRDAGRLAEAARAYARRASMGGWAEEAWYARLQQARCLGALGDEGGFVREALAAFAHRPHRAEPLHDLARFYRARGLHATGALFAEAGRSLSWPKQERLFVEDFVYAAGLQQEHSIAAYYSEDPRQRERGFAACNHLALNRDVAEDERRLARSNLCFYIQAAGAMMPSFASQRVDMVLPPGLDPGGPSILRRGHQILLVQPTIGASPEAASRCHPPPGDGIDGRAFLLRLEPALAVESVSEIQSAADPLAADLGHVSRLAGARPFLWRDELWCMAVVHDPAAGDQSRQVLVRIDESSHATCRLADPRLLPLDGFPSEAGSWVPVAGRDRVRLLQLGDPVRVVDEDGRSICETRPAIAADTFRGTTQAIPFEGGWLTLVQESAGAASGRQLMHYHRFVWINAAFALRGVSRPFLLHDDAAGLAGGLAWHPDAKRLVISYSVGEREVRVATVDAADVRARLTDVNRLPSGAPPQRVARARGQLQFPGPQRSGAQAGRAAAGLVTAAGPPRVLIAILAKQKEKVLPFYLLCIEALDYPKSSIVLHIRTNNNTDRTSAILRDWVGRVGHGYAQVEFDSSDTPEPVEQFGVGEWNAMRFSVLGRLRQESMQRALENRCDYYFVADVDNFIRPNTLKELISARVAIVAPLLKSTPVGRLYSNFHEQVDARGYFVQSDAYYWLFDQRVKGLCQVPVVHSTYLVRSDVIPLLSYHDGSGRHDYVIFSERARKQRIVQYLDTRDVYGYLTLEEDAHPAMTLIGPEVGARRLAEGRSQTPLIFVCCGLHCSGSTWMFNLVREICRTHDVAFRSCRQESAPYLPWDVLGSRVIVVKSQSPWPCLQSLIADRGVQATVTVRDPRDAVVSYMQRFPTTFAPSFEQALDGIAGCARALAALMRRRSLPVFRYEDGFIGRPQTFDRIAGLLGVSPRPHQRAPVLAGLAPDAVKATISDLEMTGRIRGESEWDRETQWHANHVGDGRVGKFQEVLSLAQQREVIARTREFCEYFGYDTSINDNAGQHAAAPGKAGRPAEAGSPQSTEAPSLGADACQV